MTYKSGPEIACVGSGSALKRKQRALGTRCFPSAQRNKKEPRANHQPRHVRGSFFPVAGLSLMTVADERT